MRRRVSLVWVAFSVAFVIVAGLAASRLTFFWDDYDAILSQIEDPFGALFRGSGVHWPPLARGFLFIETHVFGFWYPGYVLCSAALLVATWWLFARALSLQSERQSWLWLVGGVVYVTSVGVLINIFVATTLSFMLSLAFAGAAALALTSGRHWVVWGSLLAGSFLSLSGIFVLSATLVAAVYIVHSRSADSPSRILSRAVVWRVIVIVLAGVVGTGVGYVVATANPTDYYLSISDTTTAAATQTLTMVQKLTGTVYFVVGWCIAPLIPVALTSLTFVTTLILSFAQRPALFAIAGVVVIAVAATWLWRAHRGRLSSVGYFLIPAVLLIPTVILAITVHMQRQAGIFTVRYAIIWLCSVLLFWLVLAGTQSESRSIRFVQFAIVGLLSISAVVGLVRLPASMELASNADKDRLQFSSQQIDEATKCLEGVSAQSVEVVAPGVSTEDFCKIAEYLNTNSLSGKLFNYPASTP